MNKKIVGFIAVCLVILFTVPVLAAPADPASNNPSRHYPPGNYPPVGEPFWDDVPCNNFGQFFESGPRLHLQWRVARRLGAGLQSRQLAALDGSGRQGALRKAAFQQKNENEGLR